jgi:hypothetical protein
MIGFNLSLWCRIIAGGYALVPPPGFAFLADTDGFLLTDLDGAYLLETLR